MEHQVKTVCLALGPYRNLTTLTAGILFLHPKCQVLNHAGSRVFNNPEVDFIAHYSRARFDRFIDYAIEISDGGGRGQHGGSIVHSHAFDTGHRMREIFDATGLGLKKNAIDCLFWKESLRTANQIRDHQIDVAQLLASEPRLRFLMPIRNPLDCARSNISRKGKLQLFRGLGPEPSEYEVLCAILDEIKWFSTLQGAASDRFLHFFEHEISEDLLRRLARFLHLEAEQQWIDSALAALTPKSRYEHSRSSLTAYCNAVSERFPENSYAEGLLRFAQAMG